MSHSKLSKPQQEQANDFIRQLVRTTLADFDEQPLAASADVLSHVMPLVQLRALLFCASHGYCPCVMNQLTLTAVASIAQTIARSIAKDHDFEVVLVDMTAAMGVGSKEQGGIGRN